MTEEIASGPETQSPPEGGEGLEVQEEPRKERPSKQGDYATALRQIASMDPDGIRADDLGRAARVAREALCAARL